MNSTFNSILDFHKTKPARLLRKPETNAFNSILDFLYGDTYHVRSELKKIFQFYFRFSQESAITSYTNIVLVFQFYFRFSGEKG